MKFLNWFKANINLVSFVTGVFFIAIGNKEVGDIILTNGVTL